MSGHPNSHRCILSLVTLIASRTCTDFAGARSILFKRHATRVVKTNALCLLYDSKLFSNGHMLVVHVAGVSSLLHIVSFSCTYRINSLQLHYSQ